MIHKIHFDTFMDGVILSEPNTEKLSLMQRYDFNNGYGENTLLTHIRILYRTLCFVSGHTSVTFLMFKTISEDYDNITDDDIVMLYKIIAQNSKIVSLRMLYCFFINLKISYVKQIMCSLYKSNSSDNDPTLNPNIFQSLKVEIPDMSKDMISIYKHYSPKSPPPSPTDLHKRNISDEKNRAKQKYERKKNILFSRKKIKVTKQSYWNRFLIWTGCKSNT